MFKLIYSNRFYYIDKIEATSLHFKMLRASISRAKGSMSLMPIYNSSSITLASTSVLSAGQPQKQFAAYHTTPSRLGYKYVNAEEDDYSFKALTDRAATTIFWTELFRGVVI